MRKNEYKPPKILNSWKIDFPDEELHSLSVYENGKVISAYGRYAHSSGHTSCSWEQFINGEMKGLVVEIFGASVYRESVEVVKQIVAARNRT